MVSAAQRVTARSYSSLFVLVSYQLMNDLIETKYQHAEWRISIYGKAEVVIHPGQTLAPRLFALHTLAVVHVGGMSG
jgi:ABC-type molybdate transport system substrate-binding protein